MTIDRIAHIDTVQSTKKAKGPVKSNKNEGADSVSFSAEAKSKAEIYHAVEIAKAAPDIRLDRVEEVKKKLQDPSYISDKVINEVAERLLNYFEI